MIVGYPAEHELKNRITRHLSWRATSEVAMIWIGYLNALHEWGLIDVNVFERLISLLPEVGEKELREMALDEPLSVDQEKSIDDKRSNIKGTS